MFLALILLAVFNFQNTFVASSDPRAPSQRGQAPLPATANSSNALQEDAPDAFKVAFLMLNTVLKPHLPLDEYSELQRDILNYIEAVISKTPGNDVVFLQTCIRSTIGLASSANAVDVFQSLPMYSYGGLLQPFRSIPLCTRLHSYSMDADAWWANFPLNGSKSKSPEMKPILDDLLRSYKVYFKPGFIVFSVSNCPRIVLETEFVLSESNLSCSLEAIVAESINDKNVFIYLERVNGLWTAIYNGSGICICSMVNQLIKGECLDFKVNSMIYKSVDIN